MTTTDYVIDILLIAVIFRQVRPRQLTLGNALLPLVLVAVAGAIYLGPVTVRGNDLALVIILTVAGAVLGLLSGLADKICQDGAGRLLARASALSIAAWVPGMGFRFWFAYYANHSGAAAVVRFSRAHDLSGANIWTTALVIMAFGQVLTRVGALQARRLSSPVRSGTRHRPSPRRAQPSDPWFIDPAENGRAR
jgi:hypothetical protein